MALRARATILYDRMMLIGCGVRSLAWERKGGVLHQAFFFSARVDRADLFLLQASSLLKRVTAGKSGVLLPKRYGICNWPSKCCSNKATRSFRPASSSNPPSACGGRKALFFAAVQQTPDPLSLVPVGSVSGPSKTRRHLISIERNSCRAIAAFVMPFPN